MKKTLKPIEIKKVARVRDKATGDYFEVIEFPVSSTERSRLELPPSVVVDVSAFERRLSRQKFRRTCPGFLLKWYAAGEASLSP